MLPADLLFHIPLADALTRQRSLFLKTDEGTTTTICCESWVKACKTSILNIAALFSLTSYAKDIIAITALYWMSAGMEQLLL